MSGFSAPRRTATVLRHRFSNQAPGATSQFPPAPLARTAIRLLLPALLLLGGCGEGGSRLTADPTNERAAAAGQARVVVSVVDTAINPYHDFFYAGSVAYPDAPPSSVSPTVLAELGVAPENHIALTRSGDIAADIAADARFWDRVERGTPYWFQGTNIVAVSFCEESLRPLLPQTEKNPHGVGVSASVLKANPEAVLLFVESCAEPEPHELRYVLEHPAVDMLAFSYNLGLPITEAGAYRGVVELGKMIFQAAGNYIVPSIYQGGPGSWWTIGVSGIDEQANGQSTTGALLPDFVAGFTDTLPFCMDCESEMLTIGGTSISTPQATGLASRVLLELRRWLNHSGGIDLGDGSQPAAMVVAGEQRIRNWDLRRALEEAAFVDYGLEDYTVPEPQVDIVPISAVPINPVAPWLQLAWGDLSTDPAKGVVAETLAHLGFGAPTRVKPEGFCAFMAEQMRFRQTYSDVRGEVTGEVVPTPNPYQFCDG